MSINPSLLLVVEIGDGVIVSGFLDAHGELVAVVRDPFPLRPVANMAWSFEPFEVLYTVRSTINRLLQKKCVSSQAIAGMAIVGAADSFLAWDRETGKPLSPSVKVGTDTLRSEFRKLIAPSDVKLLEGITGSEFSDRSWVLALLKSRELVIQEDKKRSVAYGPLESWIASSLTKNWESRIDKTMASWTPYLDKSGEKWDSDVLSLLGFSCDEWPTISMTTQHYASVTDFYPLEDGIALHCFLHKAQAELLGGHCGSYGDLILQLGLKESHAFIFGDLLQSTRFHSLEVMGYEGYRKGGAAFLTLPPSSIFSSGLQSEVHTKEALNNYLGQSSVLMVPYQTRDGVKSMVRGLGMQTLSDDITAGFFESSAYCIRRFLDVIQKENDLSFKRVVITGDMTQWDLYNQFLSDVTQLPLLYFGNDFLGLKGAGYLLGKTLGFFTNQDILKFKRQVMKQYVPHRDPLSSTISYDEWLKFSHGMVMS